MLQSPSLSVEAERHRFPRLVHRSGEYGGRGDVHEERVACASHGRADRAVLLAVVRAFEVAIACPRDRARHGPSLQGDIHGHGHGIALVRVHARGDDGSLFRFLLFVLVRDFIDEAREEIVILLVALAEVEAYGLVRADEHDQSDDEHEYRRWSASEFSSHWEY